MPSPDHQVPATPPCSTASDFLKKLLLDPLIWTVGISSTFQNYALVENATVSFNLRIALGPGHLTKAKRAAQASALDAVGLEGYEKRPIYELSGGEQQRVALARLIIKQSDIIMADEPTGALDDTNSRMVVDTLRTMAGRGATILIATHDHTVIDACDTTLNVKHPVPGRGRSEQDGGQ